VEGQSEANVIETLGSLPEIAWGEKAWLRKEEDLTKMERMIGRERPKNSAEMLYSRCEKFAEVVQSIPAHHHTTWYTFQN
jgi:response regulator RpfG family c-di-GMP phosphodiesterase